MPSKGRAGLISAAERLWPVPASLVGITFLLVTVKRSPSLLDRDAGLPMTSTHLLSVLVASACKT